MKKSSFIALSLVAIASTCVKAYREMDLKFNPFVCLNECDQDDSPQIKKTIHQKHQLKDDTCPDGDHKVLQNQLPYWDSKQAFPCMYAGTLKVSADQDHNLFYWHFKNTALTNAPLVIWINGGPGSSSMFGLFLENGPIRVSKGPGADDYVLGNADRSWLEAGDLIFIDQPIGTGFSYGNTYLDRMDVGADEFVDFLVAFVTKYPEYQTRPLILCGESYAGKYLPHIATKIAQHNDVNNNPALDKDGKPIGLIPLNLKSVLIGDPFVAPIRQRTTTHLIAQGLNVIDSSNMGQISALRKKCEESISNDWKSGTDTCVKTMDYIDAVAGGLFSYDGSIFDYDWTPKEDLVSDFLANCGKKGDLYKAIHIDKSPKTPIFEWSSDKVAQNYDFEEMQDWSGWYDKLIRTGTKFIIYAGEYDQRDGSVSQPAWIKDLLLLAHDDGSFFKQARKIYYFKDSQNNIQVGGYYRVDDKNKFTFLTVPKAGHFVPANQFELSLAMLKDYMDDTQVGLKCIKDDDPNKCDTSQTMCTYMNNCNNHGTCNGYGKCDCNDGFKGADCSWATEMLVDGYQKTFNFNGTQWVYFQFKQGLGNNEAYTLSLQSTHVFDAYVSKGVKVDPNEFHNDLEFKRQSTLVISSSQFPAFNRFVVAVRVNGIDFISNTYQLSKLFVGFVKTSAPAMSEVDTYEYLEMQKKEVVPEKKQNKWNPFHHPPQDEKQAETVELQQQSFLFETVQDQNEASDDTQNYDGHHSKRKTKEDHKPYFKFQYFIVGLIIVFLGMMLRNRKQSQTSSNQ
ncbi:serine carboxypeptidase [Stylonychia lemnae]|uniref:Carboxypeptidase n=1 Tax=Stylonychia lemnae TaxID=5949 RepID=A0A078AY15_STYLE|nr:serine carboxypeptidase [Stylonychia lemnae]|eukprot:CDW87059.1 serine carboxypeptidase [Stylonychia lemnae]